VSSRRKLVIGACGLYLGHAALIFGLHPSRYKPFLSDAIQLILGALVIVACFQAARRSTTLGRTFWYLTACAYSQWVIGQALGTYSDVVEVAASTVRLSALFFCFWFVAFALMLLLPSSGEKDAFHRSQIVDLFQAALFFVAVYVYFLYLPHAESPNWLADSVRGPYFVVYGLVIVAFLLRSTFSSSEEVRKLFGRMGVFLLLSGMIDASFYYGLVKAPDAGTWFDLVWSLLLVVPVVMAAAWNTREARQPSPLAPVRTRSLAMMQLFPLFFPFAVLAISAGIAQQKVTWAAVFVLLSFLFSTARLLIMHHQLLESQEALKQQATHDGLTGLYNRTAIIEILERELVRAQRDGKPLGVIMADVDHFKAVNDTAGHAVGDSALRLIAGEIVAGLRPYDSVGRYGGEEFLVVAPGCGPMEAWELAERIRTSIAGSAIALGQNRLSVSVSMGIAIGTASSHVDSLLHTADTALYKAKNAGRNRTEPPPDEKLLLLSASNHFANSH
jgi:diguanylate cyclase (GGDEF)-like protein